ncbi:Photosystem II core complex proteins psbY chloroplastic [Bienertia sinuspersici]
MAATVSSLSIHIPKYNSIISSSSSKPASLHVSQPSNKPEKPLSLAKSLAIASAVVSPLTSSSFALAAKQIVESPQEDNRGLVLLVPVAVAVGWVLFNILRPALNQLNRMRNEKMTVFWLGLGGLLTSAVLVPSASAASEVAENGGGNNQGLLALVVAAAVGLEVVMLDSMLSKYEEKGSSE